MSRPTSITGGCLCGAIRYTVKFPEESDWPPLAYGTCQCNNCRKWTGTLVSQGFTVPTKNVEPALTSWPTYTRYDSSSVGYRGFCNRCGSSVSFTRFDKQEETELWVGTLDEDVLLGRKVPGTAKETVHGVKCEREGGVGGVLCVRPTTNSFLANAIPGRTDLMQGLKFWTGEWHGKPGYE